MREELGEGRCGIAGFGTREVAGERVTVPGFQVEQVALAPGGALPTGCAGLYPHDDDALARYLASAEAGDAAAALAELLSQRRAA